MEERTTTAPEPVILHLISGRDGGGAKTSVLSLLSALRGSADARLVCLRAGVLSDAAEERGIPVTVLRGGMLSELRALKRLLRTEKPALLHCHGARANCLGALLRSRTLPVMTTLHSDYALDYRGRVGASAVFGTLNRLALHRMDAWECVSDAFREEMLRRGFSPKRSFVVPNAVEAPKTEMKPRAACRAALGVSEEGDAIWIGTAARLEPVKDVETLLRAFALARERDARLRLLIAGDGSERTRLEDLAQKLGIAAQTAFLGWRDDVETFYRALDIHVLPSRSESFGYSVAEAALCGTVSVASRVGGLSALIKDGESGSLFPAGDAAALADALLTLAGDPELRKRMSEAARTHILSEYGGEETARRQTAVYAELLRRKNRRGSVICGAYGMGNHGDEAMLTAILSELREKEPLRPVTVLSRRPKETRRIHGADAQHSFAILSLLPLLRRSETLIAGGGNLLQNVTSRRSLYYYLFLLRLAKKCGCRVLLYGCGVGPVTGERDRRAVRDTLNTSADAIVLREAESASLLRELGVTAPQIVTAFDVTAALPLPDSARTRAFLRENGMTGRYLVLSVRSWRGTECVMSALRRCAEYAHEKYGLHTVLVPFSVREDEKPTAALEKAIKTPHTLLRCPDAETVYGVVAEAEAVITMRLHGTVFARLAGVPSVGISCDGRIAAICARCGAGEVLTPEKTDADALCAALDRAMSAGRGTGARLSALLEEEKNARALL